MTSIELSQFILGNKGFLFLVLTLNFAFLFLIYISNSVKSPLIKDLIYIPSRDVEKKTILLGGLGMAFSNIIVMHSIYSSDIVNTSDKFSALGYILGVFILTIQGYLDDKFELSIKAKLSSQVFAILTYGLFLYFAFPIESLLLYSLLSLMWGLGAINGSHIMDTVKTMSVKTSTIILLYYFLISYHFNLYHLSYISVLIWIPILCYWLFSKFKKNILLGEIGPNVLALSYLFLSNQLYLNLTSSVNHMNALCIVFIPLSIPMGEVFFNIAKKLFSRSYRDTQNEDIFKHFLSNEKSSLRTMYATQISLMYLIVLSCSYSIIIFATGEGKYIISFLTCLLLLCTSYLLQAKKCLNISNNKSHYGNIPDNENSESLIKSSLVETFDVDSKNK